MGDAPAATPPAGSQPAAGGEQAADAQASRGAPDEAPPGPETILLVEDEEIVRSLIRKVLQRNGYAVLEARHGNEALQIAEQHSGTIDLLLTDVVMPSISGPQLAQRLAALRPALKVLYISGYVDNTITRYDMAQASAVILMKPFTPDELSRAVRAVLDGG